MKGQKTESTAEQKERLRNLLATSRDHDSRKAWAAKIIAEGTFAEFTDLLDGEHPIGMHFSWLIGDIVSDAPEEVFPSITYFFSRRNDFPFPGFKRSLAKMMYLAGIPEEIEGEALDEMFNWVMNPQEAIAVKHYSLKCLMEICKQHPDLRSELLLVMEGQLDLHTPTYQKRVAKWMRSV